MIDENAYSNAMISAREFGQLPNGDRVTAFELCSEAGFSATLLTYGATLQSLTFPDGLDVVLGFDSLDGYLGQHPYFGGIIGRVANRISGASFEIGQTRYKLPANEGRNNLHAGPEGFDRINWLGEIDGETLILRRSSPDGHQGFPGELLVELRFQFDGPTLRLDIEAQVTKPCPVNITWHPYFNLTDGGKTPCSDHTLEILSRLYTKSHADGTPTGKMARTACSARFNYITPRTIRTEDALDKNFMIKSMNRATTEEMVKMAKLSSDTTGHKVIICSTQSCLQAYTGSAIPEMTGKSGVNYGPYHGVALEPQSYPDAVNQETFPNNILRPGEIYRHKINYTFRPAKAQA